jgi:hypothetical protein
MGFSGMTFRSQKTGGLATRAELEASSAATAGGGFLGNLFRVALQQQIARGDFVPAPDAAVAAPEPTAAVAAAAPAEPPPDPTGPVVKTQGSSAKSGGRKARGPVSLRPRLGAPGSIPMSREETGLGT